MGNTGVNSASYKARGGKLSNPTGQKVVGQPKSSSSGSSGSSGGSSGSSSSSSLSKKGLSSGDLAGTSPYSQTPEGKAAIATIKAGGETTASKRAAEVAATAKSAYDKAELVHQAAVSAKYSSADEAIAAGNKEKIANNESGLSEAEKAKYQGLTYTGVNPAIDELNKINEDANLIQNEELNSILDQTNQVDLSSSATLVQKLIKSLEDKKNETPSLVDTYNEKRKELGVGALEDSLASIDSEIAKADANFRSLMPEEENRQVGMSTIRRRQSTEELQYNRQKAELVAERTSIANELNAKYSVIETMTNLMGKDIDNAQEEYNTKFTQTVALANLLNEEEDQKVTNAKANLTLMSNLIKEGNLDYNQLSDVQKASVRQMEITAGLPSGFTSFVSKTVEDPVVSYLTAFEDESGNRIQPVATKNSEGVVTIKNINLGQTAAPSSDSTGNSATGSKSGTGMRTDRHNNPIAVAVTKNGTNQFTKALDSAGIKWSYGDAFPDNPKMVTVKLANKADGIEASRVILAETNAIQGWYAGHTGKAVLKKYDVVDNEDFKNLDTEDQDAIIKGIYIAEGGDGSLFKTDSVTNNSSSGEQAVSKASFTQSLKEKFGQLPGQTTIDTLYQAYLSGL